MRCESRRAELRGRQQTHMRYGEYMSFHRGLRPGHIFKGVARELGRSECGLTRKGEVSGADSEERTNLRQTFGSLSRS